MTGPTTLPTSQPTAVYEALRTAVLTGHTRGHLGLAVLAHRGMAAWLGELRREPQAKTPLGPPERPAISAPPPTELTRALAGMIVTLTTTGGRHALA